MSHGILQLAVTGRVPLQLEYSRAEVGRQQSEFADPLDSIRSYMNLTSAEEFACMLELI
jgi:hypothetical protein